MNYAQPLTFRPNFRSSLAFDFAKILALSSFVLLATAWVFTSTQSQSAPNSSQAYFLADSYVSSIVADLYEDPHASKGFTAQELGNNSWRIRSTLYSQDNNRAVRYQIVASYQGGNPQDLQNWQFSELNFNSYRLSQATKG
jgi:hypothetical protein